VQGSSNLNRIRIRKKNKGYGGVKHEKSYSNIGRIYAAFSRYTGGGIGSWQRSSQRNQERRLWEDVRL
jgi:hypothetical protein